MVGSDSPLHLPASERQRGKLPPRRTGWRSVFLPGLLREPYRHPPPLGGGPLNHRIISEAPPVHGRENVHCQGAVAEGLQTGGNLQPPEDGIAAQRPLRAKAHGSCPRTLASTKASAACGVGPVTRTASRMIGKEWSLGLLRTPVAYAFLYHPPDETAFQSYVKGYVPIPEMRYLGTVRLDQ